MHPAGFEPTISAGERSPTYALDRAVTGTGTTTTITTTTTTTNNNNNNNKHVIARCSSLSEFAYPVKHNQLERTIHQRLPSRISYLRTAIFRVVMQRLVEERSSHLLRSVSLKSHISHLIEIFRRAVDTNLNRCCNQLT
jgi:hypothetical protein